MNSHMAAASTLSFSDLFLQVTKGAQHQLSLLAILSWIAACDGDISPDEIGVLAEIGGRDLPEDVIRCVIQVGEEQEVEALQLSIQTIKDLSADHRIHVLTLAMGMTLADGKMTFSESAILRFLEDAWFLPVSTLRSLFRDATGSELPEVSDPSKPEYYFASNQKAQHQDSGTRGQADSARAGKQDERPNRTDSSPPRRTTSTMSRVEAIKILGLTESCTEADIRSAYLRLAKIHHPDKFEALGEDMKKAATVIFSKIQSAYDLLMGSR